MIVLVVSFFSSSLLISLLKNKWSEWVIKSEYVLCRLFRLHTSSLFYCTAKWTTPRKKHNNNDDDRTQNYFHCVYRIVTVICLYCTRCTMHWVRGYELSALYRQTHMYIRTHTQNAYVIWQFLRKAVRVCVCSCPRFSIFCYCSSFACSFFICLLSSHKNNEQHMRIVSQRINSFGIMDMDPKNWYT